MAISNKKNSRRRKGTPLEIVSSRFTLDKFYDKLDAVEALPAVMKGRVTRIIGNVVQARLPNARIGELCTIEPHGRPPVKAQVVGFDEEDIFLTPFDQLHEVGPKTPVINHGHSLEIPVGDALLGRVIDSMGEPIDGKGPIECLEKYPVRALAPESMKRERITEPLATGVKAIDSCFTLGEGQRVGVFSSAGVGKSSLLGMISRNSTADVNVIALVGERGREVLDFLEENLGEDGLARSVVIVSTSDDPALRRITAAYAATAVAEYFRDQGKAVMLLMDSLTRFARALREIALSIGEPPVRQGYPPSVFTTLPELLERAGKTGEGSITAIYTILLASEQLDDVLGEEVRSILDGHLYLNSRLAQVQHYPAIDIGKSNSRLMDSVVSEQHLAIAEELKRYWSVYEENRDLISIGAYKAGTDEAIDEAIFKREFLRSFLTQRKEMTISFEEVLSRALSVVEA